MTRLSRRSIVSAVSVALGALALVACSGPASSIDSSKEGDAGQRISVAIGYTNNQNGDPLNTGSAFVMAAENHNGSSRLRRRSVPAGPHVHLRGRHQRPAS